MLFQSISQSPVQHHHVSLSSARSCSLSSPGFRGPTSVVRTVQNQRVPTVRCSIPQVHSYGTVEYEKRPMFKWSGIYKRISLMEDPEMGAASVLNQCEKEGKRLTKWELSRIVKELRKFRRFKLALEVYEWMNNRAERFGISTSDTAIQLDLIAKVHGIPTAKDYFLKLPDSVKDRRVYGALLNAYCQAKKRDQAELLFEEMRERGYAMHSLPFNVMMTLYMSLKEYCQVESLVSEMRKKNVALDIYSYNIWLSCRGSLGSVEKMEEVFEQMKQEKTISPNWTTFSTMATMYIKMGQLEKADECLKMVETRISGRDRSPYHYLISLYGNLGKKEEVYRIWNIYRSIFPFTPNMGYHTIVSSLVRLDDIEGAEGLYVEWLVVKSIYDSRIVNLLMGWYIRKGILEKARALFEQMVEDGGKPNASTWEILAELHIREKNLSDALSCLKKAASVEESFSWRPKPVNVCSVLKLCEQEDDMASKDVLLGVLRQVGCLEDEAYMSYIPLANGSANSEGPLIEKGRVDDDEDGDGAEMLLNQLQGSL